MIAQGKTVSAFERHFASYLGVPAATAVGSGTAALYLALTAMGIETGHEVILPTYVCGSVASAVRSTGATPVLCDIGPEWLMTPESVMPHITPRTAAIIVVHLFGMPCSVADFQSLNIPLIEDCCQSLGAQDDGLPVGKRGQIGFFSFHATKCLATGEGGMVVTSEPILAQRMISLRGGDDKWDGKRVTSPLTDIQGALGISQLSRYPTFLERRRAIADRYFDELSDCRVTLPWSARAKSMFFRFPVRIDTRFPECAAQFSAHGICVRRGVDQLLHAHDPRLSGSFPNAEQAFAVTVSLPLYPSLSDDDVSQIVRACRRIWNH
jgi:UDP-4-amino-4-deoxy-L-arabinose-oxoglutarate aminotransferase